MSNTVRSKPTELSGRPTTELSNRLGRGEASISLLEEEVL